MERFFYEEYGFFSFTVFGPLHIMTILFLLIGGYALYHFRDHIRQWKGHDVFMRYTMALLLFVNMTIYYGSKIIAGTWDYHVHLPLHFCFISGYLFMYALLFNRKDIYRYVYFFSFAGPLPAILLPDLTCGMDRYLFWQFIISHHIFLLSSLYCLFVLRWDICKKDAWEAFIKANIIFFCVYLFNQLFDTNYIMTDRLPDHVLTLFPFLSFWSFPMIWLELAGTMAWMVAMVPVQVMHHEICWQRQMKDI